MKRQDLIFSMKTLILFNLFFSVFAQARSWDDILKPGDVIFQESRSNQSQAISEATRSIWGHVGVVTKYKGKWHVAQAYAGVELTPLNKFINQGVNRLVAIKRLSRGFSQSELKTMIKAFRRNFFGKSYDGLFLWDDNRIYCSELVYKLFDVILHKSELPGEKELLVHLEWIPAVKALAEERYKTSWKNVCRRLKAKQEVVVSPASLFRDPKLQEVYCGHGLQKSNKCWEHYTEGFELSAPCS